MAKEIQKDKYCQVNSFFFTPPHILQNNIIDRNSVYTKFELVFKKGYLYMFPYSKVYIHDPYVLDYNKEEDNLLESLKEKY